MRIIGLIIGLGFVVSVVGTAQAHKPGEPPPHQGQVFATGGIALIDSGGLKYFINTDITFSTSSSASAAMSEASYTHAVAASTMNGGTTMSTLNDAFDGYNALCISLTGATGLCETGNANYIIYNKNGEPTTECGGRQVVFNPQTIPTGTTTLVVSRKVFVPTNDEFARWLNIVTNTGGAAQTFTLLTSNNLGSNNNTKIDGSSNGNATAETSDTWITSFQNYTANKSTEPRLGHVLQGSGAAVSLSNIHFVNGDDNPYWVYSLTLNPGQTAIIMNYVTGQPSRAAARAKAAELVNLPPNAVQCLTQVEAAEVVNFSTTAPAHPAPVVDHRGLLALAVLLFATGVVVLRRLA